MIGHYFKRMSMLELALGDADFHLRRLIAEGSGHGSAASFTSAQKQLRA